MKTSSLKQIMPPFCENNAKSFRVTLNSEHAPISDLCAKEAICAQTGLKHHFLYSPLTYPTLLIVPIPLLNSFANSEDTNFENEQFQLYCWDEKRRPH